MSLLFPLGLLGLLTLPLILLLHLQRERPRRLRVPSVLLWQRLASAQPHPEPRRLPITLLLLLHLLIAALVAVALARPALPGSSPTRARQTIVLLDTSTSMAATDSGESRLAAATARLDALRAGMGADDMLLLVTLSPTAEIVGRFGGGTREVALPPLHAAGEGLDLRGGLNLANGLLDPRRANRIVILSDATWLPETLAALPAPVGAPVRWEPLGGPAANQAIVAFAARSLPSGESDLIARVVNYDDEPAARTLRLVAPGLEGEQVLADLPLDLPANGERVGAWRLPAGVAQVDAELAGSDAQPADDRATLTIALADAPGRAAGLPVRIVGPESPALQRLFAALPGIVPAEANLPAALTVVTGQIPPEPPSGALLLVAPPQAPTWESMGSAPPAQAPTALAHPLVRGLDLTGVAFPRASALPPAWAEPVLTSARGEFLIWRGTVGQTRVVALNFDLERSNLPAKLAFPLLMARIVTDLTPLGVPATVGLGESVAFPWAVSEFRVLGPDGAPLPIAARGSEHVVRPHLPGLHTVELGGRPVASFAAQAGAPLESDLRPSQAETLPAIAQVPIRERAPTIPVRDLAPWLIVAALAALLIEQVVTRARGR